ncbi:MAG: pyrroline-5-carboxylate reductase [Clostridia bacterium]|nr:pyrroline-5-carboxylate reductase [Clostridia bacterium]
MVGFIGCGNMASAIINGILSSGFLDNASIGVYDILTEKAETFAKEKGIRCFANERELIEGCSTVVFAVKPNDLLSILGRLRYDLSKSDPLIISIAAGKSTSEISALLPYAPRTVRIMPNINAKVCAAISAYCGNERVTDEDREFIKGFCGAFGKGIEIEEKLFSIYSAIGGCSPAFVYMFIDSLARGAVKNGMTKSAALEVAAQAVLGSAKMILESDEHPWSLVDAVCSPGGTTIEGVASLQKDGFESSIINAVEASYNKDKTM